ncbi:MAG TPA: sialidase family protein [Actinomycetota bacterium]
MRRMIALVAGLLTITALALTPSRADVPTFAPWVQVGTGISEPGVHVGPDGTIFVDGPSGLGVHSKLWRSTDGGNSYDEIVFSRGLSRLPGGGDSDVAIRTTPNGQRVYYLDLWAGSNSISVSEDNGETWVIGTPFTSLPLSDRQWIALGPVDPLTGLDTVYVLYALIQEPRQVMIARSTTGGLTWEGHFPAPALLDARGFTGQLVSDEQGFLAFVWEDGGTLWSGYSTDGGETWGQSQPIATQVYGLISGVALDGDDMHAVWLSRLDWSVQYARSADRGATWDAPQTLSAGGSNVFPWVDARDGKVAVTWTAGDAHTGNPDDAAGDVAWVARYVESLDGGTTWSASVDVGPAKTGKICVSGLSCDLDGSGGRELGDFQSVAIMPDGRSVIGFGGRIAFGAKTAVQIS